jgi:enoyl-CoA hydratase/carnithine racemase
MNSSELLQVQRDGDVVTATMRRPHRKNALTPALLAALDDTVVEVAGSDARVFILTGEGTDFCSGADLREISSEGMDSPEWMREAAGLAVRLVSLPIPTIAKVRGVAAGAGCNLALACDFVLGDTTARFAEIFAKRGLAVDFGGSWLLPRLVPMQTARRMLFFGDFISSAEACSLGLMSAECPPGELDALVSDWASRLCEILPSAIAQNKRLLAEGLMGSLADAVDREIDVQIDNLANPAIAELMEQFRARSRRP